MLLLNSFEGMGIFEYLLFSLFLSLVLSQLFHPSWRGKDVQWWYPEWVSVLFRLCFPNYGHHGVTLYILLAQIQLHYFNRKRAYKGYPFAPWGSTFSFPQWFYVCMYICMYVFTELEDPLVLMSHSPCKHLKISKTCWFSE